MPSPEEMPARYFYSPLYGNPRLGRSVETGGMHPSASAMYWHPHNPEKWFPINDEIKPRLTGADAVKQIQMEQNLNRQNFGLPRRFDYNMIREMMGGL